MNSDPIITQDNPKPFVVRVKLLTNEVYDFQVDQDINISDFKVLISPKVNVPVERMRIVYSGKQLMDDKKLSQYVQQSGMTVHLIARSAPQPQQNQPQNASSAQSTQNVPRTQNSSPNVQNPNLNQNPFDIMGMVNSMLGGVQQSGTPPQITMSFGNIGGGINGANNNPFGLLSSLGIRIPGPQPPSSTIQTNIQSNQPPVQPSSNSQSQNNTQPSSQISSQTVANQVSRQPRISYAEISQLNQRINNLNVPLDNILSQQQILTPQGVIRYLRRLHHQNTRSMLHLNRLLNLAETNNNTSNLESFIPIFESLNSANIVAINCLNELQSTRNNQQNRNTVSSSQSNNIQQPPVISMGIVISDQQMRPQNEGSSGQSNNQQRLSSNSTSTQNTNLPNRPQNQPQQLNLPQLNISNSQGPQLPFNPLQLLGSFDPNMLSSVGGVGGILGMTLREMISQGQEEPRGVFLQLFGTLTGNHLMQIFITKNFRFLQQKHPQIRQTLKKMIGKRGREPIFNSMVSEIENYIVPTQAYPTINNLQKCRTECIKNIRKYVNKIIDLSLCENEAEYDVKIIELVKTSFCENIKIVASYSTTKHENTAFEIMKYQTLNIINPILPGIGERDFVRVYNEFKAEQERRKQMSKEQGKSQEILIQLIKETGPKHSQFLANISHSDSYLGRKKEQ